VIDKNLAYNCLQKKYKSTNDEVFANERLREYLEIKQRINNPVKKNPDEGFNVHKTVKGKLIRKKIIKSYRDYDDYLRPVNSNNCRFIKHFDGDKRIIDLCIN